MTSTIPPTCPPKHSSSLPEGCWWTTLGAKTRIGKMRQEDGCTRQAARLIQHKTSKVAVLETWTCKEPSRRVFAGVEQQRTLAKRLGKPERLLDQLGAQQLARRVATQATAVPWPQTSNSGWTQDWIAKQQDRQERAKQCTNRRKWRGRSQVSVTSSPTTRRTSHARPVSIW